MGERGDEGTAPTRMAWGRIGLGVIGAAAGGVVLLSLGPPPGPGSHGALYLVAGACAILAGMLISVMVLQGEPSRVWPGSWRVASIERRGIRNALNRTAMLMWV